MKTHKTMLTLLAMTLAIIGMLGHSTYADGPTATTDDLLNDAEMALFNGLPDDIQDILADEFLPTLDEHGFDEASKADFLAAVVRLEHETRVGLVGNVGASAKSVKPGGKCYLTGPFFWNNSSNASSYSSVRCDYQQGALTSTSEIVAHGYSPVSVVNHRLHTRSNWSVAVDIYRPGLYNYCGGYQATPEPGRDRAKKPFKRVCVHDRQA